MIAGFEYAISRRRGPVVRAGWANIGLLGVAAAAFVGFVWGRSFAAGTVAAITGACVGAAVGLWSYQRVITRLTVDAANITIERPLTRARIALRDVADVQIRVISSGLGIAFNARTQQRRRFGGIIPFFWPGGSEVERVARDCEKAIELGRVVLEAKSST